MATTLLQATTGLPRFFPVNRRDKRLNGGAIFCGSFPQHLIVHSKIFMNPLVPHAGHLFPGYRCMPLANRMWNLFRRFADDLKGSEHGENGLLVLSKLGPCHAGNELLEMPGSLLNVRHLARIIHEHFCCNRRSAATTSLRPAGSPLGPSTYCTSTHRVLTALRAGLAPPPLPSPILWGSDGWGTTNCHK